jgi:hypothetical protein
LEVEEEWLEKMQMIQSDWVRRERFSKKEMDQEKKERKLRKGRKEKEEKQ